MLEAVAVPGKKKGGKAMRVRETVRAGLGEDWGEVLKRINERKDEGDQVWKMVEEEEWEREMGGGAAAAAEEGVDLGGREGREEGGQDRR